MIGNQGQRNPCRTSQGFFVLFETRESVLLSWPTQPRRSIQSVLTMTQDNSGVILRMRPTEPLHVSPGKRARSICGPRESNEGTTVMSYPN